MTALAFLSSGIFIATTICLLQWVPFYIQTPWFTVDHTPPDEPPDTVLVWIISLAALVLALID